MSGFPNIQYITHQQIDKAKWDKCITDSSNGIIYACSIYLDCMAVQWDALVLNDYEMVMPLPYRKKIGIRYLFQPSITMALGVFGKDVTQEIVSAFLEAIPGKFKVWDLSFNTANIVSYKRATIVSRNNFTLDLARTYDKLRQGYSENIHRNIAKAIKEGCVVKKGIEFDAIAAICRTEFKKFTKVEPGLFEKLKAVYEHYKKSAVTYGVFTKEGELLASCIFLFFKNRAYYWLVGNTPESRNYGASSFLLDKFIQDHAGQQLLLDFEGSDAKPVADFYKKFGAVHEEYCTVYLNKLPFPLKLLKPLPQHYRSLISQYE
ncbi:MAG: GNAT family N-acetyltransferase [Bacteroidota bacterium]|nr:GNAT family N-acetyltransferase [Bacteroidota bacterium]